MISVVPQPWAVNSTICARQTCFCGLFRSAAIAASRRRSAALTSTMIPVRMAQTRIHTPNRESSIRLKRQILSTSALDPKVNTLIHSISFMTEAGSVDAWMKQNAPNEVAMLVAEDSGKVKQAMRMFQDGYRQDSVDSYYTETAIRGYPDNVFKTQQIVDTVHLAAKQEVSAAPDCGRMCVPHKAAASKSR